MAPLLKDNGVNQAEACTCTRTKHSFLLHGAQGSSSRVSLDETSKSNQRIPSTKRTHASRTPQPRPSESSTTSSKRLFLAPST